MNGLGSWQGWARAVPGVGGLERLLLVEIARIADGRGVAFIPTAHLVAVAGRSRATVFRGLRKLENAGVLSRSARRVGGGRWVSSRFQLHRTLTAGSASESGNAGHAVKASPAGKTGTAGGDSGVELPVILPTDNAGLRQAIEMAVRDGWDSPHGRQLAATIYDVVGKLQFWSSAVRQGVACDAPLFEAVDHVQAFAWDTLVANAAKIAAARSPWAKWTSLVGFAPLMREVGSVVELRDPALLPEKGTDMSTTGVVAVGYDDFEAGGPLATIASALITAGMDEITAFAGTLRVAEIAALFPRALRHTVAGRDGRLAEWGIEGAQARAWMTLLAGSKRDPDKSVLDLPQDAVAAVAREIAGHTPTLVGEVAS